MADDTTATVEISLAGGCISRSGHRRLSFAGLHLSAGAGVRARLAAVGYINKGSRKI
jgi:hypothetical protein